MSREISYRGKRVDNGKWIEGTGISINKPIDGCQKERAYIGVQYPLVTNNSMLSVTWSEVIPETVGDCTGAPDKNGKWIFEGDIVKFRYFGSDCIGKVVFNTKTCGFEIWRNLAVGAYGEKATNTINFAHVDEIEVIGNIHDNPELLEASK